MSKRCKHEATFGPLGSEYYHCLECGKDIPNEEWEDDKKALKEAMEKIDDHPKE